MKNNQPTTQTVPSATYRRNSSPLPPSPAPPSQVYRVPVRSRPPRRRSRSCLLPGCLVLLITALCLGTSLAGYMFFPGRTNLLLLGVDYVDPSVEATVARSDTIILATVDPVNSYIGMLSIPRDLWVPIPGFGENRINTAHFFGESQETGGGPRTILETIRQDFGVPVQYYLRLRFEGFREVVYALGGVELELDKPMAGYPAGINRLKARKALGFVRDRTNSDDFHRMEQGQAMFKSLIKTMAKPKNWPRFPAVIRAMRKTIDTNVPVWMWPRLALTFLWVGPDGIDSRVINRDMVTPFTTDQGAQVLLPNWPLINAVVQDMFKR